MESGTAQLPATLIAKYLNVSEHFAGNVIYTLIVFIVLLLGRRYLPRLIERYIPKLEEIGKVGTISGWLLTYCGVALLIKIWVTGKASLATYLGLPIDVMDRLANSAMIVIMYLAVRRLLNYLISLRESELSEQYSFAKTANAVLLTAAALLLAKVWIGQTADFSTYFGLLSAGIAIALQDILVSMCGFVFLMVVQPFSVGQRIQVGKFTGDVVDIRMFQFAIMEIGNWVDADQPTGRILHFPNSFVFKNVVANYHSGFNYIWSEIPVMITFESNWQKARTILDKIAQESSAKLSQAVIRQLRENVGRFMIRTKNFEPSVWIKVADSGVTLTIRYLCDPMNRRSKDSDIWTAVLNAFHEQDDIDLAYPTQRFYNNTLEGKAGAGGPQANA